MARRHNDAQILCMGGRVLGEGAAVEVLRAWLAEEFEGGRHERRLALIGELASGSRQPPSRTRWAARVWIRSDRRAIRRRQRRQ